MPELLYVSKRYGTYSDQFFALGLAKLADNALYETNQPTPIQIIDDGIRYQIKFGKNIELESLADLRYFSLFQPVVGAKTNTNNIPEEVPYFDAVKETETRRAYREYLYQGGKKLESGENAPPAPNPCTQNGVILTSMRHDRNHNGLWEGAWNVQENFGDLVSVIFEVFSEEELSLNSEAEQVAELFKQRAKGKIPAPASAVKIFMPTAVQGVTRIKADNNKSSDSSKDDWLNLWLIAAGLFEFGLAERVKISESSYDWRVLALNPKNISLSQYQSVLNKLRQYNPPGGGHGIARFDAELVLKFSEELLNYHPANENKEQSETISSNQRKRRRQRGHSISSFVTGFSGTHFGSKGQVYGVKELFSLGLPDWVSPENQQDIKDYLRLLQEHLRVIQALSVDEGHGELLAAYRDFITGGEIELFFKFCNTYADYVVRQLADSKARNPRLFTQQGLDIMTQSMYRKKEDDFAITEITENPGFLRVARAINSATVYAGKIQTKEGQIDLDWERNYGLAQRLSSQSGSKKDFIIELASFLSSYENENMRISEKLQEGKRLRRVWTTKEDLDQVLALIDKFSSGLVANLLVAYGYSRWNKPLKEESSDTPTVATEGDAEESKN